MTNNKNMTNKKKKEQESIALQLAKWIVKKWCPGYHVSKNPVKKKRESDTVPLET